ncbi:MAG: ferrous iron transport protein B [Verrucomicrobia bacterium]|nr:MAG: ferrous iron transport protein B [Verrucomicrobiota bacterium]
MTTVISSNAVAPASSKKQLTLALVGNPNCGKTTLFNALTGLRQKVGNYPGVTVEKQMGTCRGPHGEILHLIDLPGTYSLNPTSPDERITTEVLLGLRADTPPPDCILCLVDATSLQRHLFLVSQILELGLPVILVLTMMDLLEKQGMKVNDAELGKSLNCPVIPCDVFRRKGLVELRHAIVNRKGQAPAALRQLSSRDAAFRLALFEPNLDQISIYQFSENFVAEVVQKRNFLEEQQPGWRQEAVANRYHKIQTICSAVIQHQRDLRTDITQRLDRFLTHPIWGWVAFGFIMTAMFLAIFVVANYPMDWIQSGFTAAQNWIKASFPPGEFTNLIADGALAGLGAVITYMPQILILFFFIGLLEDTGYMARAAFIMDHLMNRVGLHGKSFIPLLSSFACAIPGIMATRTISSTRDRLATILIAPFMSCSARLPVYTLMIAVLFPPHMPWAPFVKAGVMVAMYALGIIGACFFGWVFKKTILKSDPLPMVMELPPYHLPALSSVFQQMLSRAMSFFKRAGTVILGVSIILWFLSTHPKTPTSSPDLALKKSFAGQIGQALEPLIRPLGFNWKIGVGLVTAQAAREVFLSTLGVAYSVEGGEEATQPLREALLKDHWPDGQPVFTPLVCVSLMVFFVFSLQCMSTVAVVRRETNSWTWPAFQFFYMLAFAYLASFVVYQTGRFLHLG